jgi:predicted ATPase/DNA-binding SARP family transcriptional activator
MPRTSWAGSLPGGPPGYRSNTGAALWGDEPPRSALASLRTYVYRLREGLGDDGEVLASTHAGHYRLVVPPEQLDAARFERLVETARDEPDPTVRTALLTDALALWRGPAFGELADGPTVRTEAQRLDQLRTTVEEERFSAMLRAGQHAAMVEDLAAFVARHPLRETARCDLAVALFRTGRQADALATLRELRARLVDDLGLDPSEQVIQTEHDLLNRAAWLDGPSPERRDSARVATASTWLPLETTELIGRSDDLERLLGTLDDGRLVTVTGVGGVGKTRLAVRTAHTVADRGSTAVCWCDLSTIELAGDVAPAVAAALDLRPAEPRAASEAVVAALRDRDVLLVLDNAEHLLDGVAALVDEVLVRCPQARLLITSRAPLGLPAERIHRLAPLPVDVDGDVGRAPGPALELMLTRARAARPDLVELDDGHDDLVALCRRLDGLPLAIELAAARLRTLNPTDLLDRLDERPALVAADGRRPHRHAGLRTVLDWSFRQLSSTERRLFARLSVFPGVFDLDTAEAVCAGDGIARDEIAELLGRLVDHSLVELRSTTGPARYGLLETLRAHGREELAGRSDEAAVRRRHAEHHLALAAKATADIRGRDEAAAVRLLDRHLDDLRSAYHWILAAGDTILAVELVSALFRYALWRLRGEILRWAETVADLPGAKEHPRWPVAAGMAGWGAGLRGELTVAEDWAGRVLDVLPVDDPRTLAAREVRMHTALWSGRLDDCLGQAELAAALTDDPYELVPSYVPGLALTYAGRPDAALDHLADVQQAADRHGNPTMRALVRYAQAEALLETVPAQAHAPLEDAVELAREVDNRMVLGVADVSLIGLLTRTSGDTHRALATFRSIIAGPLGPSRTRRRSLPGTSPSRPPIPTGKPPADRSRTSPHQTMLFASSGVPPSFRRHVRRSLRGRVGEPGEPRVQRADGDAALAAEVACLAVELFAHALAGFAVDLDGLHLEQVGELPEGVGADVHVPFHRRGVRVDREHGHPVGFLVDGEPVEQQLVLPVLDELGQLGGLALDLLEAPRMDPRSVDVQDRSRHGTLRTLAAVERGSYAPTRPTVTIGEQPVKPRGLTPASVVPMAGPMGGTGAVVVGASLAASTQPRRRGLRAI